MCESIYTISIPILKLKSEYVPLELVSNFKIKYITVRPVYPGIFERIKSHAFSESLDEMYLWPKEKPKEFTERFNEEQERSNMYDFF